MLDLVKELNKDMWVIFDLDGTLADIEDRRILSTNEYTGKMNWDKFFNPTNIELDQPHMKIISLAQMLKNVGFKILILSGRSKVTKEATIQWLKNNQVPYNVLKMRPTSKEWKFMADDKLKQYWLDELFPGEDKENKIFMVFDDRDKVVKMWRRNDITCLQVADGDF